MSSYYDDASLMLLASGGAQKDGKVYSVKPTDGSGDFTFTRGSNLSATRVDASQLIEKGRENLALQSNTFSSGSWYSGGLTETSGQSGYDGSLNAWLIEAVATGTKFLEQNISSGVNTLSIYAKAGTTDWIMLNDGGGSSAYFDIANGVLGSNSGADYIDHSIESISSGWYRCSLTSVNIGQARIYLAAADGNLSNSIGNNILIQDAQLEQGLVATPYIETGATTAQAGILENTPRFDYSGGATCPSLLLEPSRTNVLEYSEYFDSSYYTKASGTSLDFGYLAPDGTNSAYKLSGNTASIYAPSVIDSSYSRSIWARTTSGTGTAQLLSYFGNTNNIFNITEEWQRFEVSSLTVSTGDLNFYAADLRGVSTLDEIIIWGGQAENASYATSYIPTYGVSQTRVTDICGITNIPSSIIDTSTAHSGFIEVKSGASTGAGAWTFGIDDGTYTNYIKVKQDTTSGRNLFIARAGGSSFTSPTGGINTFSKFAWTYDGAGVLKYFIDGVLTNTNSITFPSMSNFGFGEKAGFAQFDTSFTKQALLFPTALSDLDAEILTGATTYNTFAEMALALNYTVYE